MEVSMDGLEISQLQLDAVGGRIMDNAKWWKR